MREEPGHGDSQSIANSKFDRVNEVLYLSRTYGIHSWSRQIHCSDLTIHSTHNLSCRLWAAPILNCYCGPTDLAFPIHWVLHDNWDFIVSQRLLLRTLKPCTWCQTLGVLYYPFSCAATILAKPIKWETLTYCQVQLPAWDAAMGLSVPELLCANPQEILLKVFCFSNAGLSLLNHR